MMAVETIAVVVLAIYGGYIQLLLFFIGFCLSVPLMHGVFFLLLFFFFSFLFSSSFLFVLFVCSFFSSVFVVCFCLFVCFVVLCLLFFAFRFPFLGYHEKKSM